MPTLSKRKALTIGAIGETLGAHVGKRRGRDGSAVNIGGVGHSSDQFAPVQEKAYDEVHTVCAPVQKARESMEMPSKENDGDRLDQVLAGHGLNRARLAKRTKKSASTIQKWYAALQRGDITETSWNSCARALMAVGIDPAEVRPGAEVPKKTSAALLIPALLDITDRATLSLILEVLSLDDENDKAAIEAVVKSALKKI